MRNLFLEAHPRSPLCILIMKNCCMPTLMVRIQSRIDCFISEVMQENIHADSIKSGRLIFVIHSIQMFLKAQFWPFLFAVSSQRSTNFRHRRRGKIDSATTLIESLSVCTATDCITVGFLCISGYCSAAALLCWYFVSIELRSICFCYRSGTRRNYPHRVEIYDLHKSEGNQAIDRDSNVGHGSNRTTGPIRTTYFSVQGEKNARVIHLKWNFDSMKKEKRKRK